MIINDLPTEVIVPIISDAISSFGHPTIGSRNLMAICRLWYDIITSSPEFWTDVWSIIYTPHPHYFQWLLRRLAAQLARCKGALIDVHWQARMPESHLRQVMEIFGKYAPFDRWRSLYITAQGGDSPEIRTLLPPLGVFRSLETLHTEYTQGDWLMDYVQSTLPQNASLREFRCDSLVIRVNEEPESLFNILTRVNKLHAGNLLVRYGGRGGLPANITDLTLAYFHFPDGLDLSHVERITIQNLVNSADMDIESYVFSALRTLDIAFSHEYLADHLNFPALVALRIRGPNCRVLSDIDAPKLQLLVTEGRNTLPCGDSLKDVIKRSKFELEPSRGPEVGILVATDRVWTSLSDCPALEKLGIYFLREEHDINVIRILLFPSSFEDKVEEQGKRRENTHEHEFEMLRPNISPSDRRHDLSKLNNWNLSFLTVFLERIQGEEDLTMWAANLRRFEGNSRGGTNKKSCQSLGSFWMRPERHQP